MTGIPAHLDFRLVAPGPERTETKTLLFRHLYSGPQTVLCTGPDCPLCAVTQPPQCV